MEYNSRSTFSWSFNGYSTEEAAKKALEDMQKWFEATFKIDEWQATTSLSQTPQGYRAALSAQRETQIQPETAE